MNSNLIIYFYAANEPCDGECSFACAVIDSMEQCYCPTGFELSSPGGTQCVGTLHMHLITM